MARTKKIRKSQCGWGFGRTDQFDLDHGIFHRGGWWCSRALVSSREHGPRPDQGEQASRPVRRGGAASKNTAAEHCPEIFQDTWNFNVLLSSF